MQYLSSRQNPRYKEAKALKERKGRQAQQRFLVEGHRILSELVHCPEELLELWISEEQADSQSMEPWIALANAQQMPVFTVPEDMFRELSDTVHSQGVVAITRMREHGSERFLGLRKAKGLYADGIQDPGNLGTMIRSAEALGFDFIVVPKGTTDPYNEKCVRATMGSVFHVPIIRTDEPDNELEQLKDHGFQLYGAELSGALDAHETRFSGKMVLVIGSEANGISGAVKGHLDHTVKIPMCGTVESLNASIAMSILAYEILRQERAAGVEGAAATVL